MALAAAAVASFGAVAIRASGGVAVIVARGILPTKYGQIINKIGGIQ